MLRAPLILPFSRSPFAYTFLYSLYMLLLCVVMQIADGYFYYSFIFTTFVMPHLYLPCLVDYSSTSSWTLFFSFCIVHFVIFYLCYNSHSSHLLLLLFVYVCFIIYNNFNAWWSVLYVDIHIHSFIIST